MSESTNETEEPSPRVAIYMRVSTAEQTHEPQRQELLAHCGRMGWENLVEFVDQISGAKFTRVGLDRMMKAVRKGLVDVILCVKLDRLGRSLPHLAQLIAEMEKYGVALICPTQGIDTRKANPAGRLQMHVLMAVAEFERSLIRERTKAGLVAAKSRGAKIGRPKVAANMAERVKEALARVPRPTVRAVAKELGISVGKVSALGRI